MFTPERKLPQSEAPNAQWKARKYRFAALNGYSTE
jgi:hypothetical protein